MRKRIQREPDQAPAARARPRRRPRPEPVPVWPDRLLLHLESEDPGLLDKETAKLYRRLRDTGAETRGPVPLPVRFEGEGARPGEPGAVRVHRRIFKIHSPTGETVALLEKLPLSGAVSALVQVEEPEAAEPPPAGT